MDRRLGLVLLAVALLVTPVAAHVPSDPGDNDSPAEALTVTDAAKSWSYYDDIDGGGAQYYRVTVEPDERLRVSAFTPVDGRFTPSLVVMAPGIEGRDAPPGVTVPEGMGAVVVEGERPDTPGYEPFGPSANYGTAALERDTSSRTTYLVALYEPANRSGPAGLAVGYRETFTPAEYAALPFSLVETHLWEGQHPVVAVGPFVVAVVGGGALLARGTGSVADTVGGYALGVGGLLVAAGAVNTLVQIGIALAATGPSAGALVTAVYVVVPGICGWWALRVARRPTAEMDARTRVGLAVAGLVALGTWAGFVVGPALIAAVAVGPRRVLGWPGEGGVDPE